MIKKPYVLQNAVNLVSLDVLAVGGQTISPLLLEFVVAAVVAAMSISMVLL